MKNIRVYILALGLIILSSCQDWLDINNDPSFPQDATAEIILPVMFAEMVRGEAFDSRFVGSYVQNWARTTANSAEDLHGYYALSDNIGEKWRQHYFAIGRNIDVIIADATAKSAWWYVGVAYAIRAWSWQTSTDVYGEMILEQAWEDNRYVFDYDTQEEVYAEVVRLCELALEFLDRDDQTNTLGVGDLVYAGDRNKWKKFVYAILARNAHHLSNKPDYDPDAVIGFVDQALAANTDNFNVPHLGTTSTNANFWGPTRGNLSGVTFAYRQSAFSIGLLNGTAYPGITDPRLAAMFQPSTDGVYRGATNGQAVTITGATGIPTLYNKYIYRDNVTLPIFTYSEMQFIKAEAAFIKADLPTALTAYTNAINAHFDYVASTLTGAALTTFNAGRPTYLASAAVAQNTGELSLDDIMMQKYIAMYGHGILETWVDMRRYEYDDAVYRGFVLPSPLSSTNNGGTVQRIRPRYNSEYVWNVKALEQIGALATDYHTKKLWFVLPD
jgi:hypothetical protein